MLPQSAPTEIFHGEDHSHIEQPAPGTTDIQVLKKPFEGCKQAGGAVDREHPQGSITGKTQIPAPKGVQRCEQDLHAPAAQPAQEKAPAEGFKRVCDGFCHFHGHSI